MKRSTKTQPRKRGVNIIKEIRPERKLVSRAEAARLLGYHPDSIKRLEKRRGLGGTLDVVKLRGPNSNTFYKIDQLNELIEARTVPTDSTASQAA
jgi:hypothetical protein